MARDDDRPGAAVLSRAQDRDARRHRWRAGAQPALPPPRARGARALGVRVIDRCNLTDPQRAGLRGPRRLPGARGRRDHRVAAVLHEGERRPAARRRRVRVVDPGAAQAQRAGLRQPTAATSCSISSTTRWARACRRRRIALEADLQARARGRIRHRVQPALHARQHADRALRLDARLAGQVRELHGAAASPRTTRTTSTASCAGRWCRSTTAASCTTAISTRCSASRIVAPGKPRMHLTDLLVGQARRTVDRGRRSLLRLHGGTGFELRRARWRRKAGPLGSGRGAAHDSSVIVLRPAVASNMRISIVVPALDEADGIVATLAPLQPLRAAGHEMIVVDGGSRDATLALRSAARGPGPGRPARTSGADERRRRGGDRRCPALPARRHAPGLDRHR